MLKNLGADRMLPGQHHLEVPHGELTDVSALSDFYA